MRTIEYAVLTILALAGAYWIATTVSATVSSSLKNSAAMIREAGDQ
jgi:hypothetical protein